MISGVVATAWSLLPVGGHVLQVPAGDPVLDRLLSELTLVDGGLIAGSAVATIAVVRWVVRQAAPSLGASPSTTEAVVSTTASSGTVTGSKADVAFTLPTFLPVSKGIRQVSHNEVHAFELGLVVGLALTWLYSAGYTTPVATILVVFVTGSLGYRWYSSKAFRTVRHEPWYGLMALTGGCAIGYVLFVTDASLPELLEATPLPV